MATIYSDYGEEPKDSFLPLPEQLSCDLYSLEMDGFTEDIAVFNTMLPAQGSLLELGCGTGRLSRAVAGPHRPVTGIDILPAMLQTARQHESPHCSYISMDMTRMGFATQFDIILIGYNTLNLLCEKKAISACLAGCKKYLHPKGILLLQLHLPTKNFIISNKKTFQFQVLDRPGGGKVIKEILKKYYPRTRTIQVEERYRIRPMTKGKDNEDYRNIYAITGFQAPEWFATFKKAGFSPTEIYGDYHYHPINDGVSSMMLGSFSHVK